jgi:hypothetical protein
LGDVYLSFIHTTGLDGEFHGHADGAGVRRALEIYRTLRIPTTRYGIRGAEPEDLSLYDDGVPSPEIAPDRTRPGRIKERSIALGGA